MKNLLLKNPALERLEFLIGKWNVELYNASFLPDPSTKIKDTIIFEWIENGAYIVMRQGNPGANMFAIWTISKDRDEKEYKVLYYDNRKISRLYNMSVEKDVWKIWRNNPKFSQRFTAKISKNKRTIKASWEKSMDGRKWEHDFDMNFARQ